MASPFPESPGTGSKSAAIYSVGTLRYTRQQLFVLFFWLMWNDFSITLIEQVGGLNGILMRDHYHATFTQMALLGTIGFWVPWLNPLFSTWSDRHRGNLGRRRPFLFYATPPFAFFLGIIPYMPTIYHWTLRYPFMVSLSHHFPMSGEVLFIGLCGFVSGIFNAVVMAIFSYLYWDVVPENLMGRFQSLSKNATLIAGLVWSYFIYGLADYHMKAVYVGTSIFCLLVYLVSVWQIKEGEYPPPDVHKKGGLVAPIRAYFVECFGESYYLWIFIASLFFQLGNQGGGYQFWYVRDDLHFSLAEIGWIGGTTNLVTTGFGLALGFAIGSLTDRLLPVRLMAPLYVLQALVLYVSLIYVTGQWTWLASKIALSFVQFFQGVALGAFTVEVFPREKLGQFCSAQAVFYQIIINILNPFIAMFYDWLHNNRIGFLWQGSFYLLAAIFYHKVYLNWKERKGRTPVPHAG